MSETPAFGTGLSTAELRSELQEGSTPDLDRRRKIIQLSLAGIASMAAVTLLQTGVVKHLPDPPLDSFDSDKVNSSETAYALGTPDGTLSLAGLALNIPIAAFGGAARFERQPAVPLLAAGKAMLEAAAAGWYFYQMPAKEKSWCAYCIAGAAINFSIFALTVPEAIKAFRKLTER
ncbi:MAG: vitamin K epoxide reductase family protein [Acidobacteriaceae bacterium]|nr:vitamin K epoxide reductase family protein [Acidobacteriaceae bacterium]MBV9442243.1 vitamin K epoxide reductase family protein [Acidobacteriaceae bacterium]